MNNYKHDLDKVIKDALREEFDNIEPTLSSSQAWQRFKENNKQLKWLPVGSYSKVLYPIFCLLIFFTLFFMTPYNGNAFNKVIDFFESIQGNVANLFMNSSDEQHHSSLDEFSVDNPVIVSKSMSLNEAIDEVSFPVLEPRWVPENFQLVDVIVYKVNELESNEIHFLYMDDHRQFIIKQIDSASIFGLGADRDLDESNTKEVFIHAHRGNIVIHRSDYLELFWVTQDQYISIEGNLSEEELLKIAESM